MHSRVLDQIRDADAAENPLAIFGRRETGFLLLAWPSAPDVIAVADPAYHSATESSAVIDGSLSTADARLVLVGTAHVHPDSDRTPSDLDLVAWAKGAAESGRPEIGVIASIDEWGCVSLSGFVARQRSAGSGPAYAVEPVDVEMVE